MAFHDVRQNNRINHSIGKIDQHTVLIHKMRKIIEVNKYPDDGTFYIRYSKSERGYTEKIGPELQGPTQVRKISDEKKFSWLPKQQFIIIVDYNNDNTVSGIEVITDNKEARMFLKNWCQERELEFPEL